jgi:hypothetical protein
MRQPPFHINTIEFDDGSRRLPGEFSVFYSYFPARKCGIYRTVLKTVARLA